MLTWARFTEADFGAVGYNYESSLQLLMARADRAIDDYCRQPPGFFEPGGVSIDNEYHSGVEIGYYGLYPGFGLGTVKPRPFLRLEITPVLSVVSLEDNTSGTTWTSRTEGRDSDYLVEEDGVRYFRNVPKYDYKNVRVSYMAGYETTPGRVEECSERLSAAYGQSILDARIRTPSGTGDVNVTPTATAGLSKQVFTSDLKRLVNRFKRRVPVRVVT